LVGVGENSCKKRGDKKYENGKKLLLRVLNDPVCNKQMMSN